MNTRRLAHESSLARASHLGGLVRRNRTCGITAADEERAREGKSSDPFRAAQRISLRSAQRISFSGCFPHIGLGRQETVILQGNNRDSLRSGAQSASNAREEKLGHSGRQGSNRPAFPGWEGGKRKQTKARTAAADRHCTGMRRRAYEIGVCVSCAGLFSRRPRPLQPHLRQRGGG